MNTKEVPLEPCPFCGGEPRYLEFKAGFYTERVICDACHFYLAPENWNRRMVMGNALEKHADLNAVLHRNLLDTGLITVDQWNAEIAPALCASKLAIERAPNAIAAGLGERDAGCWIVTAPSGRVMHINTADGWSVHHVIDAALGDIR